MVGYIYKVSDSGKLIASQVEEGIIEAVKITGAVKILLRANYVERHRSSIPLVRSLSSRFHPDAPLRFASS